MIARFLFSSALALLLWTTPASSMTADARNSALESIANLVRDHYVYKDKAALIAGEIRNWKNDPAILSQTDERLLASLLSNRLREKDRHFSVFWRAPNELPAPANNPSPRGEADHDRQSNYGFDEVKRLPGNIGYIRLSYFADFDTALTGAQTPAARKTGEAALNFLSGCDAVIFDLRRNGGGSPATIDLLLSAFFGDKPVLLNRFYQRDGNKTEDYTTLANYSGMRRPDVPLFVLIGGGTASAAEEFSYDLQAQKRGQLVGEPTYGGANPGAVFLADGGFSIFISNGAAINPVTGTNWEGDGVQPDIAVPVDDAFARAYSEALKTVIAMPNLNTAEARAVLAVEIAKANPPKTAPLTDYRGDFGDRHIQLKEGALSYTRGRSLAVKLIALAPEIFGCEEMPDIRFQFVRNASGHVETLTLSRGDGSSSVFARTSH